MQQKQISDIHEKAIITPEELKHHFPLKEKEKRAIVRHRKTIANIIHGQDPRLLVVCGPCSIHDTSSALEYAQRLRALSVELNDQLYIVMRVYFEKPRTAVGWKGLINDPFIDESFDITAGLQIARGLLLELVKIGLPAATETLDLHNPQYLGDLFSWSAIGARTIESQIHREIASGLSMPVGFKNSTDGNYTNAINAMYSAAMAHRFLSINQAGRICVFQTSGNPDGHLILRGGKQPNYQPDNIANCKRDMLAAGFSAALMIDCSHDNSNRDHRRQVEVAKSILAQIKAGDRSIIGLMLESHINAGKQSYQIARKNMRYGVSITDSCMDWESTENLLRYIHNELFTVTKKRTSALL